MYEIKHPKEYKIIVGGLLMFSSISFISIGLYNLSYIHIGGKIELILGIIFALILPCIFAKHIIIKNKKIVYYNGLWLREVLWDESEGCCGCNSPFRIL